MSKFEYKLDQTYNIWLDNQESHDLVMYDAVVKLHLNNIKNNYQSLKEESIISCFSSAIYLSNLNSFFENIPQYLYDFYLKNKALFSPGLATFIAHHCDTTISEKKKDNVVNMFDFKIKKINQLEEDKLLSEFKF